ncbi:MAG: putative iron-sulfur protein [Acidimicrobiia bacterium]|nr:putative iron-sulfur protein [Acidimicrobiia bacterium]
MSAGVVVAIALGVLVVLAAVMIITSARRAETRSATGSLSRETRKRDRSKLPPAEAAPTALTGAEVERVAAEVARPGRDLEPASPAEIQPYVPVDPDLLGFTRRQFMNRTMVSMMLVSMGGFGAAMVGFLWPSSSGGFGSVISLGKLDDILTSIQQSQGFYYVPEGRAWITAYPADALPKAKKAYDERVLPGMEAGIVALYQKCVHLGCRVPSCLTSQWFECPCHGSQYNRVGEKKGGPAPRGLDRFPVKLAGSTVTIDTGNIVLGPPIGTNTTGQEAEGPHCVTGGE